MLCFLMFFCCLNYGCKKTETITYTYSQTTYLDPNKNSTDPYIKYNMQRMAGVHHWKGTFSYLPQDEVIPITFLNDTTIYFSNKPLIYVRFYTTDSSIIFVDGPTIYIDNSSYVEYLYLSNILYVHSVMYESVFRSWKDYREFTAF